MIDAIALSLALHLPSGERPDRPTQAHIIATASHPPARWRLFARCVEHRESNNQPHVINSSGHMGLFQFSREWQRGLSFMVAERLREYGMSRANAKTVRQHLTTTPINHWPAQLQRVGFAAAISIPGNDRHWALAGSTCERFR